MCDRDILLLDCAVISIVIACKIFLSDEILIILDKVINSIFM